MANECNDDLIVHGWKFLVLLFHFDTELPLGRNRTVELLEKRFEREDILANVSNKTKSTRAHTDPRKTTTG